MHSDNHWSAAGIPTVACIKCVKTWGVSSAQMLRELLAKGKSDIIHLCLNIRA